MIRDICKKCGKFHALEYQIQSNGTKHLVIRCLSKKGKLYPVHYYPFEDGLPLKTYTTEKKEKIEPPTLFD